MSVLSNKSWGDEEFEEETKDYETPVDENGIKYSYQFKTNEDGKKIRVTRKIRVSKNVKKVNKRVEERRQRWKKFGKVAGVEGIEPGATYRGDEVFLVMGEHEKMERERQELEKRDKKELEELYTSLIVEGRRPVPLGGPTAPWRPTFGRPSLQTAPSSTATGGRIPSAGAYVPPHKSGRPGFSGDADEENTTTLRVTNLSDETSENDLSEMFRDFGNVSRVYLVRDKESNQSRGFAFVTFQSRSNAESAMNKLNGTGWDHLILSIEWAKPSIK
jgi:translation initiation factor 3 subunit G